MGTLDEFLAQRAPVWNELEALVERAGGRPARLGAEEVRRLGNTYRAVAADLAIARRQFPGHPMLVRLERLVPRARAAVYHSARSRQTLREFVTAGYWRRVRERGVFIAVAALCFFGPLFLGGYWAWRDPGPATGFVPGEFEYVTEPRVRGEDWGFSSGDQAAFSSQIFTNNIRVAILAFAGGMLAGVGAILALLYNGLVIGAVIGLGIGAGNGSALLQQVTAHGVLELSCIVVAGGAGLRLGWSMIDPGNRPRAQAVRVEARGAAEMLLGTAAWLVVAGLVEGFVTPSGYALGVVLAFGFGLGALFWGGVAFLGRRVTAAPAP